MKLGKNLISGILMGFASIPASALITIDFETEPITSLLPNPTSYLFSPSATQNYQFANIGAPFIAHGEGIGGFINNDGSGNNVGGNWALRTTRTQDNNTPKSSLTLPTTTDHFSFQYSANDTFTLRVLDGSGNGIFEKVFGESDFTANTSSTCGTVLNLATGAVTACHSHDWHRATAARSQRRRSSC